MAKYHVVYVYGRWEENNVLVTYPSPAFIVSAPNKKKAKIKADIRQRVDALRIDDLPLHEIKVYTPKQFGKVENIAESNTLLPLFDLRPFTKGEGAFEEN